MQPECDADVDHQQGCGSTTESSGANDAVVTRVAVEGGYALCEAKPVRGEIWSLENSEPGTCASTPRAGGSHGEHPASVFPSG